MVMVNWLLSLLLTQLLLLLFLLCSYDSHFQGAEQQLSGRDPASGVERPREPDYDVRPRMMIPPPPSLIDSD